MAKTSLYGVASFTSRSTIIILLGKISPSPSRKRRRWVERGANGRFPVAIGNSNKSLIASIYPFAPVTYGVASMRWAYSSLSLSLSRLECVFIGFTRGSPLTTGAVRSLGKRQKVLEEHYSSSEEAVTVIFRVDVVGKAIRWTRLLSRLLISPSKLLDPIDSPIFAPSLGECLLFKWVDILIFQSY